MARQKLARGANPESVFWGKEDLWDDMAAMTLGSCPSSKAELDAYHSRILRNLTWYRKCSNQHKWKAWTISYLKDKENASEELLSALEKLNPKKFDIGYGQIASGHMGINVGIWCRMASLGAPLLPDEKQKLQEGLSFLKYIALRHNKHSASDSTDEKHHTDIQERIKEQVYAYCGELNAKIDEYILSHTKKLAIPHSKTVFTFDIVDWMRINQIKGLHSKKIADHFRPLMEELQKVLSLMGTMPNAKKLAPNDDGEITDEMMDYELVKAYSYLSKADMEGLVKLVTSIVDVCTHQAESQKAFRKPRKKKVKPASEQVKMLVCQMENADLGVKSVPLVHIVGSSKLVVYNAKYRSLAIYESKDVGGFGVKGQKLLNWDESKSVTKRLRHPKETVKVAATEGIRLIRQAYKSDGKTKEKVPNGKLSKDCIVLAAL
jgi:hypothetical protein